MAAKYIFMLFLYQIKDDFSSKVLQGNYGEIHFLKVNDKGGGNLGHVFYSL